VQNSKTFKVFLSISFSLFSFAGGTIDWSTVQELMDKNPGLSKTLSENFQIAEVGTAVRIGGVAPLISGARVAPYVFCAKTTLSTTEGWTLALQVNAKTSYFDVNNKEVPLGESAAKIVESNPQVELLSVESVYCPD